MQHFHIDCGAHDFANSQAYDYFDNYASHIAKHIAKHIAIHRPDHHSIDDEAINFHD